MPKIFFVFGLLALCSPASVYLSYADTPVPAAAPVDHLAPDGAEININSPDIERLFREGEATLRKIKIEHVHQERMRHIQVTENAYQEAVELYKQQKLSQAKEVLSSVKDLTPGYKSAEVFLKKIDNPAAAELEKRSKKLRAIAIGFVQEATLLFQQAANKRPDHDELLARMELTMKGGPTQEQLDKIARDANAYDRKVLATIQTGDYRAALKALEEFQKTIADDIRAARQTIGHVSNKPLERQLEERSAKIKQVAVEFIRKIAAMYPQGVIDGEDRSIVDELKETVEHADREDQKIRALISSGDYPSAKNELEAFQKAMDGQIGQVRQDIVDKNNITLDEEIERRTKRVRDIALDFARQAGKLYPQKSFREQLGKIAAKAEKFNEDILVLVQSGNYASAKKKLDEFQGVMSTDLGQVKQNIVFEDHRQPAPDLGRRSGRIRKIAEDFKEKVLKAYAQAISSKNGAAIAAQLDVMVSDAARYDGQVLALIAAKDYAAARKKLEDFQSAMNEAMKKTKSSIVAANNVILAEDIERRAKALKKTAVDFAKNAAVLLPKDQPSKDRRKEAAVKKQAARQRKMIERQLEQMTKSADSFDGRIERSLKAGDLAAAGRELNEFQAAVNEEIYSLCNMQ